MRELVELELLEMIRWDVPDGTDYDGLYEVK